MNLCVYILQSWISSSPIAKYAILEFVVKISSARTNTRKKSTHIILFMFMMTFPQLMRNEGFIIIACIASRLNLMIYDISKLTKHVPRHYRMEFKKKLLEHLFYLDLIPSRCVCVCQCLSQWVYLGMRFTFKWHFMRTKNKMKEKTNATTTTTTKRIGTEMWDDTPVQIDIFRKYTECNISFSNRLRLKRKRETLFA